MAIVQQNFAAYLRTLRILFIALMGSQVMVVIMLYFLKQQQTPEPRATDIALLLQISPILIASIVGISFFLYRKKLADALAQPDLIGKLTAYRAALLLRWAPLEGVVILTSVLYFLTGIITLLYAAVAMILLLATQWPTRARIVTNLELSTDEQLTIDDPNTVVSEISQRLGV